MKLTRRIFFYLFRLFRQNKGAHNVALGFVVGFYPCWFPTFGVGPALSVALTKFMKGNVLAALVAAGLGSVIWAPLFILNYKTGQLLRKIYDKEEIIIGDVIKEPVPEQDYTTTAKLFSEGAVDFIIGSVTNSIVLSVILYFVIRIIFSKFRPQILQSIRRMRKKHQARADG